MERRNQMKVKQIFVCNNCKKEYKSRLALDKHQLTCQKQYRCETCGFTTLHENMFLKHVCPTYTVKEETHKVKCPYCNANFAKEKTLITHMCKKKERYLNKNTRETLLAFEMWSRFRERMQLKVGKNSIPMEVFLESHEFEAFYKFAAYSLETKLIEPLRFIDNALSTGLSIDIWTTNQERKKWIIQYLKSENATAAVERSILTITKWSEYTGNDWKTFFYNASSARFIQLVCNGDISPWFIYCSSTYEEILNRLSDSEFMEIYEFIDPAIWKIKQHRSKEEFIRLQDLCKEFGI